MEKVQLDQLDMLQAVENHFNDNTAPWLANVPVSAAKTLLSQKITAIAQQYAIQLMNTTGIAEDKLVIRTSLEDQLFVISSAVSGYANATGKNELYRRVYNARSTFERMKAAELVGVCVDLINDTNTEMANLAPYGVLPANITTLTATMNAFSAIKANPEEAIFRRKTATDKIAELLPDALTFLNDRMDNLIVALEATQETFVDIYRNARFISSSPTTTISLTTLCIDSVSNEPINKVTLTVLSNNEVRKSGESGFNIFKNLPEGNDKLRVEQPDYETQTIDYTLVNGITKELVVTMVLK